ncbi:hypothetical protein C0J52_00603 [Blattella germanica]|nr:hypothetical protein C0J52_00603 [Blattella germanica]
MAPRSSNSTSTLQLFNGFTKYTNTAIKINQLRPLPLPNGPELGHCCLRMSPIMPLTIILYRRVD